MKINYIVQGDEIQYHGSTSLSDYTMIIKMCATTDGCEVDCSLDDNTVFVRDRNNTWIYRLED